MNLEYPIEKYSAFDSVDVYCSEASEVIQLASEEGYNFRVLPIGSDFENAKGFGVTFDELTCDEEIYKLHQILAQVKGKKAHDLNAAIACYSCHQAVDGQRSHDIEPEWMELMFRRGQQRTIDRFHEKGLL